MLFWIKIGLFLALTAAVAWGVHSVVEHFRDQGREEIRAEWQHAVEVQKEAERQATAAAEAAQLAKETKRGVDFARLAKRTAELESQLAAIAIDPATVGGLRNSVRTANGEGPTESPKASSAVTGLALDNWFQRVAEQYRACREQVDGWITWDDRRVAR